MLRLCRPRSCGARTTLISRRTPLGSKAQRDGSPGNVKDLLCFTPWVSLPCTVLPVWTTLRAQRVRTGLWERAPAKACARESFPWYLREHIRGPCQEFNICTTDTWQEILKFMRAPRGEDGKCLGLQIRLHSVSPGRSKTKIPKPEGRGTVQGPRVGPSSVLLPGGLEFLLNFKW